MAFTALGQMLLTERYPQRSGKVGFAVPYLYERAQGELKPPFLVTNLRCAFLPTQPSREGMVRMGLSPASLEDESKLLVTLHHTMVAHYPDNIRTTVQDAVQTLQARNKPRTIVVPPTMLGSLGLDTDVEKAQHCMQRQGFVAVYQDMQVLLADLPEGMAFVASSPSQLGLYVRTGDYLGLLFQQIDQSLAVVS